MADAVDDEDSKKAESQKSNKASWLWPLGLAATGLAGLAVLIVRGCWHRRMSWPIRVQEHSYRVCLDCGIKQLFDEKQFCSYGPYRYGLEELIDWQAAQQRSSSGKDLHQSAS